ncbi:Serine acetyltransferase 5 [Camellia lanceoleosa]|uniref:Serine acetyltransferase 5 n=1 Tax=Camellia lanceoleosa TaxID=1840588 RepID=A0ACC0FG79_9ERIC|nr:Serine acetyltransferase 5 [Camellia lanceoleosa]
MLWRNVHLGNKLCSSTLLYDLFLNTFSSDFSLRFATVADLRAARIRDPACLSFSHCLFNYKGLPISLALHSWVSDDFSVDIHPAARIENGVLLDYATAMICTNHTQSTSALQTYQHKKQLASRNTKMKVYCSATVDTTMELRISEPQNNFTIPLCRWY